MNMCMYIHRDIPGCLKNDQQTCYVSFKVLGLGVCGLGPRNEDFGAHALGIWGLPFRVSETRM